MSYGHADKIAGRAGNAPPVDPALLARPDVRAYLAVHDFGSFYRVLCENGWSQHGIAKATKTQQSQVCEILKGRQVIDYRVLVRIAEGLGIPRELMGLGSGAGRADGAYAGGGHGRRNPGRGECGDASPAASHRRRHGRCGSAVARDQRAGRLFATASMRRWEGGLNQRARTWSSILLATIHIRAGESRGLQLAHGAIVGVTKLSSVRARQRLEPLVAALDARPGSDHRELARMARHGAATRA